MARAEHCTNADVAAAATRAFEPPTLRPDSDGAVAVAVLEVARLDEAMTVALKFSNVIAGGK